MTELYGHSGRIAHRMWRQVGSHHVCAVQLFRLFTCDDLNAYSADRGCRIRIFCMVSAIEMGGILGINNDNIRGDRVFIRALTL